MDNEQIPMIETNEERPAEVADEPKKEEGCPYAHYIKEIIETARSKDHPLSPFAWIGVNLIMLIPPVNLLFLFLWACGGTERTSLKNYARGILLTVVLLALVFLVTVVILDLCGYRLIFPKWLNDAIAKY